MPSGCWCPLTRQLCIQRTSFIHPLTQSLRKPLWSTYSVSRKSGLFEAGRNELRCPTLALVGHGTWFDLRSLNIPSHLMRREWSPPSSLMTGGLVQRPTCSVPSKHPFLYSSPQRCANHRGSQPQLRTDQARSTQKLCSSGIHLTLSPSSRNVDGIPGRKEARAYDRCQGWCLVPGLPLCFVINL